MARKSRRESKHGDGHVKATPEASSWVLAAGFLFLSGIAGFFLVGGADGALKNHLSFPAAAASQNPEKGQLAAPRAFATVPDVLSAAAWVRQHGRRRLTTPLRTRARRYVPPALASTR